MIGQEGQKRASAIDNKWPECGEDQGGPGQANAGIGYQVGQVSILNQS